MISRETDPHSRQDLARLKRGRRDWPKPSSIIKHLGIDSSGMGAALPYEDVPEKPPDTKQVSGDIPEGLARGIQLSETSQPETPPRTEKDSHNA